MATRPKQRNLGRLSEIAQVAVRHGFGYALDGRKAGDPEAGPTARGRHLREMLDELGPTFVKFGQLLSTRPDIVPPDIIAELRGLQDDVRPFPFADIERTIRDELGQPIERLFTEFDEKPLAAASIGQVHRATLPNGRLVAVKVQRPNAPRQIEADLALMYQAARLAKERIHALDFIDTNEIVDEFSRTSSTTGSKRATRTASTRTLQAIRTSQCRASTGPTRVHACLRWSTWTACSWPISSSTSGRSSSGAGLPTSSRRRG